MNGFNFQSLVTTLIILSTTFHIVTIVQSHEVIHSISRQHTDFTIKCCHKKPNSNSEVKEYVFVKNRTVYGVDNQWLMKFILKREANLLGMFDQNFTSVNLNLRQLLITYIGLFLHVTYTGHVENITRIFYLKLI